MANKEAFDAVLEKAWSVWMDWTQASYDISNTYLTPYFLLSL